MADASRADDFAPLDPTDRPDLPDINDRLAPPGTPYEVWDGELVRVPPADPPHAERHIQLAALIEAHTGPEFESGADLLTRTSRVDDIAPDVSVYPVSDPATGRRKLEHIAFEIVSRGSLSRAGRKAAKLTGRGVRRVFAIDVVRSRALEWSVELGAWRELDPSGRIEDPALAVPLPIAALIHDAKSDDAIARALLAKRNSVLVLQRAEAQAEGKAEGKAEAVVVLLAARGIAVDGAARARILGERDPQQIDRWIARAATCAVLAELFADR